MVEHFSELPRKFVYFTLCICRSDKWLGDSVFFHQMADNLFQVMKTSLPCCLCLMTIAMAIEGGITLEHTCADLEFPDLTDREPVHVLLNSYFNLTFHLNTSDCTYFPEKYFVRLSLSHGESNVPICYIVYKNEDCSGTDPENCVCLPGTTYSAVLYRHFTQSGRSLFIWSLSDSIRENLQKKIEITFYVDSTGTSSPRTTRENISFSRTTVELNKPDLTSSTVTPSPTRNITSPVEETVKESSTSFKTTSPRLADTESDGDNFQVIIFTSIITLLVVGVPFVTAMIIYVHRIKKRIKGHLKKMD